MRIGGYFSILRRWWWTLLLAAITASACGYLVATTIPPTYESRIRLLVGPVNADLDVLRGSAILIPTYAELVTSEEVLADTADRLGIGVSAEQLRVRAERQELQATANDLTRILTIRVVDVDGERAAQIAQGLADSLIKLANRRTNDVDPVLSEGRVQVVEPGAANLVPIAPNISLLGALAGLAGLVGALVLILLLEYARETIRDADDLDLEGVALLGPIIMPRAHRKSLDPFGALLPAERRARNSFALLATRVIYADQGRPVSSLLVLGTEQGVAIGEATANLAALVANAGSRVALVDANDEDAQLTRMLGSLGRPGVAELLEAPLVGNSNAEDLKLASVRYIPGMDFFPRGVLIPQLVTVEKARHFIDMLTINYDLVIVNCAAVQQSASALAWSQATSAVLVLVHRDVTKRENLAYALESFRPMGARLGGIALVEGRGGWPRSHARQQRFADRLAAAEAGRLSTVSGGGQPPLSPLKPEEVQVPAVLWSAGRARSRFGVRARRANPKSTPDG